MNVMLSNLFAKRRDRWELRGGDILPRKLIDAGPLLQGLEHNAVFRVLTYLLRKRSIPGASFLLSIIRLSLGPKTFSTKGMQLSRGFLADLNQAGVSGRDFAIGLWGATAVEHRNMMPPAISYVGIIGAWAALLIFSYGWRRPWLDPLTGGGSSIAILVFSAAAASKPFAVHIALASIRPRVKAIRSSLQVWEARRKLGRRILRAIALFFVGVLIASIFGLLAVLLVAASFLSLLMGGRYVMGFSPQNALVVFGLGATLAGAAVGRLAGLWCRRRADRNFEALVKDMQYIVRFLAEHPLEDKDLRAKE